MTKTPEAAIAARPPAPRMIVAGALPIDIAQQLRVVDAGTGEPIAMVLDADADAGTVRRYAVEDGNLVREGDSFAIVEEKREIRIEWIEPAAEAEGRSLMYALAKVPTPVTVELIAAFGDRPAVTVTFPPQPSLLSIRAARRAVIKALQTEGPNREERGADAFTIELIRHNILDWSGIGDETGEPVEPTHDVEITGIDGNVVEVQPGTITAFLAEPRFVETADREWVLP